MKVLVLFVVSSCAVLLAQENEMDQWSVLVRKCSQQVLDLKDVKIEKQDPMIAKVALDFFTKSCGIFAQSGLRQKTNDLMVRRLISPEIGSGILRLVVVPAEQMVPRLQGTVRRGKVQ